MECEKRGYDGFEENIKSPHRLEEMESICLGFLLSRLSSGVGRGETIHEKEKCLSVFPG